MVKLEIITHRNNKFMFIDGDLWMWDTPRERELQQKLAQQAFGDVLVVGYGFGIVSGYLLQNQKVTSIVTIEKNKRVLEKVQEFGELNGKVLIADFYTLGEEQKF